MLITSYYSVIGDEKTYRIGLLIARYSLSVKEIGAAIDLPQPRISHKLAKLRKHGCVNHVRKGQRVFYSLVEPCRTVLIRGDNNWRQLNPEFEKLWLDDLVRVREILGDEISKREIHPAFDV